MSVELTESLQQALDAQPDEPLRVVDPRNHKAYVLIREESYKRLQESLYDDSEIPIGQAYPLMDAVAAKEGWDDPEMGSYDKEARGKLS